MPVNKHLMDDLRKQYGTKRGTSVYYAMENSKSKTFNKGISTAKKEGHTAKNLKAYEKAHKRGGKK